MAMFHGGPCDGEEMDHADPSMAIIVTDPASEVQLLARYDRQADGSYRYVKTYRHDELEVTKRA